MSGKTIKHKRSSVSGNIPNTSQVSVGELAINFADRSLYTQDTLGNIIELERDVYRSSSAPTDPTNGDLWFDSDDGSLKVYRDSWIPAYYNGKEVTSVSSNVTPYEIETGTLGKNLDTVSISGLVPGQMVEIVDQNATVNGGRFRVTEETVSSDGVLKFIVRFNDSPPSSVGTSHTAEFKIGEQSLNLTVDIVEVAKFPQHINAPEKVTEVKETLWNSEEDTITASGCLEISSDGSAFGSSIEISSGDYLYLRWKGLPNTGTCMDEEHGTTISGTLTSSNGKTQDKFLQVDKTPDTFIFYDDFGVGTDTLTTSNPVTLELFNSYGYLYYDSSSATDVQYSKNGGAFTDLPASLDSAKSSLTYCLDGDILEIRHRSSSDGETTVATNVYVGNTNDIYSTETEQSSIPAIQTPEILVPVDESVDNTPKPLIVSSDYVPLNGAGDHDQSDWEVYEDEGLTSIVEASRYDTENLTSYLLDEILEGSTEYFVRVKYRDENGLESNWSNVISFTTEKQKGTTWTYHGVSNNLKGVYMKPYKTGVEGEFYLKNTVENQNVVAYMTTDNENWTRQRQIDTNFSTDKPMIPHALSTQFSNNLIIDMVGTGSSTKVIVVDPSNGDVENVTGNLQFGGGGFELPNSVDVNDVVWMGPKKDGGTANPRTCQYSEDYGQTWTKFTLSNPKKAKPPVPSALLLNDQNLIIYVYSGGNQTSGFGFYHYSLDNGNTWIRNTQWEGFGAVAARDTERVVSNNKALLTYTTKNDSLKRTGVYIFRSTDAVNWTDIKSVIQAEKVNTFTNTTAWQIFVDNNGQFIYADDQGDFLLSKDDGLTWKREEALYASGWNANVSIDAFVDKGGRYYIHNTTTGEWATSP